MNLNDATPRHYNVGQGRLFLCQVYRILSNEEQKREKLELERTQEMFCYSKSGHNNETSYVANSLT
jgi:hypothetical protein